jgi:hypothetical protein
MGFEEAFILGRQAFVRPTAAACWAALGHAGLPA